MRKTEINQKMDKQMDLGTTFLAKNEFPVIWGSQGGPLGKPWRGFWEENLETKKVKKKRVKGIASADTAYPGKERFREDEGHVGKV